MLSSVTAVSAPGFKSGIITLLQDELLTLKFRILISYPAGIGRGRKKAKERENFKIGRFCWQVKSKIKQQDHNAQHPLPNGALLIGSQRLKQTAHALSMLCFPKAFVWQSVTPPLVSISDSWPFSFLLQLHPAFHLPKQYNSLSFSSHPDCWCKTELGHCRKHIKYLKSTFQTTITVTIRLSIQCLNDN